jgi:hypothetical protein
LVNIVLLEGLLCQRQRRVLQMPILRMRDARFFASGAPVGPVSLDVAAAQRLARVFTEAREASIVALMAAGIIKAGAGTILIGDYDPRVQSAHCKRLAAFVPHAPLAIGKSEFDRYVLYRAALWNVAAARARGYARLTMERLNGIHEAFAYAIAGALLASPQLLVLDRPQAAYASKILDAAGSCAVFSTHESDESAAAFCDAGERVETLR